MDLVHILFVFVVPSTLMISEAEHGRKRQDAGQFGILAVEFFGGGSRDEKQINDATFANPVRALARMSLVFLNVHKGLGRIEPKDTACSCMHALTDQQWHRTIERHGYVQVVFKDVKVVQTERVFIFSSFSSSILQHRRRCMLGQTVQGSGLWKSNVCSNAHGAIRLGIFVRLKIFLPQTLAVQLHFGELPMVALNHLPFFSRTISVDG
mmetsp:Transcript_72712/g.204160  ORF Transcript_72712/g.204160 Transcript_72712/m.204160 type:complete len:209 (-) Transcript_72712:986-1612(-)